MLAYNKADMILLVQAVRNGNPELYGRYSDEEMMAFLKPHQVVCKAYYPWGCGKCGFHIHICDATWENPPHGEI